MTRKWWTLVAVCAATFMLLLDITVVNQALPAIQEDLGASFIDLQWVLDAYTLPLAALVLTAGALADRYGRRAAFVAGLVIFTGASLLCALAPDPLFLNLARAVQGLGAAIMFAVSLALIAQEFHARERGLAMGIYGATLGAAVAVGPLVGGVLTEALGWESIFYLNIPIGLLAILVTQAKVAESRDPTALPPDWPGVVTLSTALFALVFALLRANVEGWGSSLIVGLLAGSTVLLVAFIVIELRVPNPMLPLGLFRLPSFTGAQVAAFGISASLFSTFLYLSLYLQNILGHSALEAGLRYLPITLLAFFVAPVAGVAMSRVPSRLLLGVGLGAGGLSLILMAGLDPDDEWTALLAGFVLAGFAIGLVNPVIAAIAVGVVPRERSGMATGINDTFRQVGFAVGIAAYGALLVGRGDSKLRELAAGTPATEGETPRLLVEAASSGNLSIALRNFPGQLRDRLAAQANEAFIVGLNDVLIAAGVLCLLSAVASFVLMRERDLVAEPAVSTEPAVT
jgi:EmrB/QacA subfamily drug resistance transporter